MKIPFNTPAEIGSEFEYMQEALRNRHMSGDGPFTRKCQQYLADLLDVPAVLVTSSCTHALEMTALLLDIQPGDEVIVPAFTFVSTTNAYVLRGAKPIFADIRPDTLNLDETKLESLITPRTKAVVPVHYAGVSCDMDAICELASKHHFSIIEDNAHGLFGSYKGKPLGTFGSMATQSFHETKNVHCGEGGALLINDPQYYERAEIIREKGTNRSRFFRGQVDKYTWVDVGSSYLISDMMAGFLLAQLEHHEKIQEKRKRIWHRYDNALKSWAEKYGVIQPTIPPECDQTYHMYYLLLPTLDARQAFIQYLRDNEIWAVFHYLPLHLSDMGKQYGYEVGDCPVTEALSDRLVRLPMYYDLSEAEQDRVIDKIESFEV